MKFFSLFGEFLLAAAGVEDIIFLLLVSLFYDFLRLGVFNFFFIQLTLALRYSCFVAFDDCGEIEERESSFTSTTENFLILFRGSRLDAFVVRRNESNWIRLGLENVEICCLFLFTRTSLSRSAVLNFNFTYKIVRL